MFGAIEQAVGLDLLGDLYGADSFCGAEGLVVEITGDKLIPKRELVLT